MYPGPFVIFGTLWATWTLVFLFGVLIGIRIWSRSYELPGSPEKPSMFALRYIVIVYVCAVAAQMFAYAFDSNTTLLPIKGVSFSRYYLNPLAGPKTLYGAFLALPFAVRIALIPSGNALLFDVDRATPSLMTILGVARVGCFLQGCCYGIQSQRFGVSFPAGSSVHGDQVLAGLVHFDQASLPVLPTQIPSAIACFLLALWSFGRLKRGHPAVFVHTLFAYSAFRFAIEFLRADPARNHAWMLSTSQWIALLVIFLGGISLRLRRDPGTAAEC